MANVRLLLPSRPENVGLVREALAGLADALVLSREQYDDVRTAVTEACNNVVQHAYLEDDGPLELEVLIVPDAIEVLVRDEGVGIHGVTEEGAGELDIGLPVMLALAERLQVGRRAGGGTEVQMRFAAPGVEAPDRRHPPDDGPPEIALASVDASARIAFATTELAEAILPRIAMALAARAHFSADRVSDVQLVSDAIARSALALANGRHLEVAFATAGRRLDLQVGPLRSGGAQRLQDGSLSMARRLVDERTVRTIGPDEVLVLRMLDRHSRQSARTMAGRDT